MSDAVKPTISMIDADTLSQWIADDTVILIDVREEAEHQNARIHGSTLVPLSSFDPTAIPSDGDKKVVLHCASGQRCGMAAEMLRLSGFPKDIHRLQGGIGGWYQAGHPIES